jgi:branched-chain amino acid transport system permease protein
LQGSITSLRAHRLQARDASAALPEIALLVAGIALYMAMPDDLGFATRILIAILFTLSLDFVLGYAGIVTLGHAAMFGAGAYAAGIFAIRFFADPTTGLLVGAAAGALVAGLSAPLVLRSQGLTSVMITLAVAQLLQEVASKARTLTGGDDGLSGILPSRLLGVFEFDFVGRTGFWYALGVLVLCFALLRRLAHSPFGLTCVGIREDRTRMLALGSPVAGILTRAYMVGGAIAGVAGALSAQITQVVGLHSLSLALSAETLVMLVLGGTGRLWGAVVGAAVFLMVHHYAAAIDPFRWMLVIGVMLLLVVLVLRGGIWGGITRLREWWTQRVRP